LIYFGNREVAFTKIAADFIAKQRIVANERSASSMMEFLANKNEHNFEGPLGTTNILLKDAEWKIAVGQYGTWIIVYQGKLPNRWERERATCYRKLTMKNRKIAPVGMIGSKEYSPTLKMDET
jgi:hypothetical protein